MRRIHVIDALSQRMGLVLNGRRCTLVLNYNTMVERWSFDLSIDATPALSGRRIVLGINLLQPFDFGIGAIFALGHDRTDIAADFDGLVSGRVRLYHATADDLA